MIHMLRLQMLMYIFHDPITYFFKDEMMGILMHLNGNENCYLTINIIN